LCLTIVRICNRKRISSIKTLTWGGLRGGLSIALALSVPTTLGGVQTGPWIFGATYMIVVFSIIIQGGSLQFALARKGRHAVRAEVHSS
jgi:CPA1 family monovalent cation:H+ antiporter